MGILGTIKSEITDYHLQGVPLATGQVYSEHRLKRRINLYEDKYYPTGAVNANGEVEWWPGMIAPRINDEIKNLRLDSKYFLVWHVNPINYFSAVYIANASLSEFMDETGRAEELMASNEHFSGRGNLLFRKTTDSYEEVDLMNTYITNTLAKNVDQTAIIERFYLTQSELRGREGIYKNVDSVIKNCKSHTYKVGEVSLGTKSTTPLYECYRRSGEVSEKVLFESQGKEGGDPDKFILAMVIVCGMTNEKDKDEFVLFAEEMTGKMSDHFKEAHRGAYKGRWWREGLTELLMDAETRYNELTNQIMRSIPWDSSAIFRHTDVRTQNSLRTKLKRGSLIKSADIQQVQINARITEAVSERNHIISEMDRIAGSFEVVQGITPASGTPLGTTQLMNENANKLYDFLRKKLAVPYRHIYREFVLPSLVKNLKGKEIIKITGNADMLDGLRRITAESWYVKNLALIGPHPQEAREQLINTKIEEMKEKDPLLKNSKEIWKGILPGLRIVVTGEGYSTSSEISTAIQLLPMEADPGRRAFLLDWIYKSKGLPVPNPPPPPQPQQEAVEEEQPQPAPTV